MGARPEGEDAFFIRVRCAHAFVYYLSNSTLFYYNIKLLQPPLMATPRSLKFYGRARQPSLYGVPSYTVPCSYCLPCSSTPAVG